MQTNTKINKAVVFLYSPFPFESSSERDSMSVHIIMYERE